MRSKGIATLVSGKRSAWALLVLAVAPGCLGGQTGEPTNAIDRRCWPASEFPDQQFRVWTEALNQFQLRPTNWPHPQELPLRLVASLDEDALACAATSTRTDWWVDLTLVTQEGAVFSQNTQLLGENVQCAGCYRLHLSTNAAIENTALIFDAEEARNASHTSAELDATVVGNANAAPTISGSLTVRYQLTTSPGTEQSRRFDF